MGGFLTIKGALLHVAELENVPALQLKPQNTLTTKMARIIKMLCEFISSQVRQDERAFGEAGIADELEDGLTVLSPGEVSQLDHQPRDQRPLVAQPRQHEDHVEVQGGQVQEQLGEVRGAAAVCKVGDSSELVWHLRNLNFIEFLSSIYWVYRVIHCTITLVALTDFCSSSFESYVNSACARDILAEMAE